MSADQHNELHRDSAEFILTLAHLAADKLGPEQMLTVAHFVSHLIAVSELDLPVHEMPKDLSRN